VRTLENAYTMQLDSMTLTMDGEELPPDALGELDIQIEHSETYVVTDTYEAVEGGKPRRLRRSFDELGGRESSRFSSEEGEKGDASEYASELEGKAVVFTWDEETGRFDAAFAADHVGAADLLADLDEDMDLRRLLPERPVAEGESWSIDPRAFSAVLDPGGDLGLEIEGGLEEGPDDSDKEAQLRANLAGSITATYRGTRADDGVHQALIALACEISTYAEQPLEGDEVPEGTNGTDRIEIRFDLEGELCWDLAHGHASSFELSGANEYTDRQTFAEDFEGQRFEHSQTMAFSGQSSFSMRVERR
jgi:hypothetical protein